MKNRYFYLFLGIFGVFSWFLGKKMSRCEMALTTTGLYQEIKNEEHYINSEGEIVHYLILILYNN